MLKYKPDPPSMLKVAIQDPITAALVTISIVVLIALVVLPLSGQMPALFGFLALLFLAVAVWRVVRETGRLRAFWERGIQTTARILSVEDVQLGRRGRGQRRLLRYTYSYDGHSYEKSADVGLGWIPGEDEISILVDPQKPDDALLLFKYL